MPAGTRIWKTIVMMGIVGTISLQGGCANMVDKAPVDAGEPAATLTPEPPSYATLSHLPLPAGKIIAAVYGFQDLTGQYKPSPASSFSTAITQGGASMLIGALLASHWFTPVERVDLQDLLTERKVIRAAEQQETGKADLRPLYYSSILLTGGVVGYDSDVKTGGAGAKYFGIGASDQYREDQVTVDLRAVDVSTGQILLDVSTTKTIFSYQLDSGVFRFIQFKRLLQAEAGYTRNEPTELCLQDAIDAAVSHLIADGIRNGLWNLKNPRDINSPALAALLGKPHRAHLPRP